jgi:hypothetical protein
LGFTGTRQEPTDEQLDAIRNWLLNHYNINQLHHGDCVGADKAIHGIVEEWFSAHIWVVLHPPVDSRLRAFCHADEMRLPRPYLERNREIVNETDHLLAVPQTAVEAIRSGTWSTVRYARSHHRPITVILPTGELKEYVY